LASLFWAVSIPNSSSRRLSFLKYLARATINLRCWRIPTQIERKRLRDAESQRCCLLRGLTRIPVLKSMQSVTEKASLGVAARKRENYYKSQSAIFRDTVMASRDFLPNGSQGYAESLYQRRCGVFGSHLTRRLLASPKGEGDHLRQFLVGNRGHLQENRRRSEAADCRRRPQGSWQTYDGDDGVRHGVSFGCQSRHRQGSYASGYRFLGGTYLAQNVLEAVRVNGVGRLLYTSGSGVYGEHADVAFSESFGPCLPISTYGASKLACEALIGAYCHMLG